MSEGKGVIAVLVAGVLGYVVYDNFLRATPDIPSPGSGGVNVRDFANAIAEQEGFGVSATNRPTRLNNPGDLKVPGDLGVDKDGFGIFSSADKGMAALESDLAAKVRKYPNYSILEIITRYLGGNPSAPVVTKEGDPFAYANSVAKALGVSANTRLKDIFGG